MPRPAVEVGVLVADLERSTRFYVDALGFEVAGAFAAGGARVRGLRRGSALVKLVALDTPVAERDPSLATLGLRYLTIAVDDVAAATARCVDAGAELVRPVSPFCVPGEVEPRAVTSIVLDPEGTRIELCQGSPWMAATSSTGDMP